MSPSVLRSLRTVVLFIAIVLLSVGMTVTSTSRSRALSVVATPVASGLAKPAAMTFAPDGRIFYGEQLTGEIHILDPGTGSDTLFFTIPGAASLLGLAVHPSYPTTPFVYAYGVRSVGGVEKDQLVRLTATGDTGGDMRGLFTLPSGHDHHGGPIAFGPDGKLYVSTGDEASPAKAQSLSSLAGKMLRLNPNGSVPRTNPFGSRVWAFGLRNTFGFDFDPTTGSLWGPDNGPECNDEINRVVKGGNYAWGPSATCVSPPDPPANTNQDGPTPRLLPKRYFATPVGPTGATFCTGCGLGPSVEGTILFGDFNAGKIRRVTLNATRTGVASVNLLFDHSTVVLAVASGPDGTVYFSDFGAIYRLEIA
jgi:aldose sugar dehydrogenase